MDFLLTLLVGFALGHFLGAPILAWGKTVVASVKAYFAKK